MWLFSVWHHFDVCVLDKAPVRDKLTQLSATNRKHLICLFPRVGTSKPMSSKMTHLFHLHKYQSAKTKHHYFTDDRVPEYLLVWNSFLATSGDSSKLLGVPTTTFFSCSVQKINWLLADYSAILTEQTASGISRLIKHLAQKVNSINAILTLVL